MKNRNLRRGRRGFTLMEVLLVLVILVILGSVVAVSLSGARKRAFVDSAKTQLSSFKNSLAGYQLDVGSYPPSLDGLRNEPPGVKKWRGPYSDANVPDDPWGNAYGYEPMGSGFKVWSDGPDGISGTEDDVILTGE